MAILEPDNSLNYDPDCNFDSIHMIDILVLFTSTLADLTSLVRPEFTLPTFRHFIGVVCVTLLNYQFLC